MSLSWVICVYYLVMSVNGDNVVKHSDTVGCIQGVQVKNAIENIINNTIEIKD